MKQFVVLIFTLCFLLDCYSQTSVPDYSVESYAKSQFELLVKQDFGQLDSLYMTEAEVREMCSKLEPLPEDSKLTALVSDFDQKKQEFIDLYKFSRSPLELTLSGCDSVRWDSVRVDSVAFAYEILNPVGRNKKVYWPASKTHVISEKEITICKAVIYFNDGVSTKLACSVNGCYYNGRWRHFEFMRSPKFVHITN